MDAMSDRKACFGMLQQKRCWVPSVRGWLVVSIVCISLTSTVIFGLYPFLALNRPVKADLLIVEGWVADYALEFAVREYTAQSYSRLITTGGPLAKGWYLAEYKTFADLSAATLRRLGMASNSVVAVPSPQTQFDRTYQSALATRKWFEESGQTVKAINVITIGAHARRTRLVYQRVFGKHVAIGVVSVPRAEYEEKNWWKCSAGLRDVMGETIGYLHAKFFSS